jgi:MFS family permease
MRMGPALLLVFLGGFAIMVLEIVGARFLAADFGGSFYVWVSQIGVILSALAAGYFAGGSLADRFQRPVILAVLLVPAGLFTWFIPDFAPAVVRFLVERHPVDHPIPLFWQKADPVLGSSLVFLLPGFVLATLSPCMIRLASQRLHEVGRVSGAIFSAGTLGGILGVFLSGYVLLDHLSLSVILRSTGVLTMVLGAMCMWLERGSRLRADRR